MGFNSLFSRLYGRRRERKAIAFLFFIFPSRARYFESLFLCVQVV